MIARLRRALALLARELARAVRDPRKLLHLLRPSTVRAYLLYVRSRLRLGDGWQAGAGGLETRPYRTYEEYLRHQRGKPRYGTAQAGVRPAELLRRVEALTALGPDDHVLCLGAGEGDEVATFRRLGCVAWGVDLDPALAGALVLPADFHHLPFRDAAFDAAYSNSLDHAFGLDPLVAEVARVVRPGGTVVLDVSEGHRLGLQPGVYESVWWHDIDDVVARFTAAGFVRAARASFDDPWPSQCVVLRAPS